MPTVEDVYKTVLWKNVLALMIYHWGGENLPRLSREAKIGPGTASRIKASETSVGLDVLQKVADAFHVQPWQLLVPEMDPQNPPVLLPISKEELDLYERLKGVVREFKDSQ